MKTIFYPVDDYSCSYCKKSVCVCKMQEMENADPHDECDAFFSYEDDCDEVGFDPYEGCYTYDC